MFHFLEIYLYFFAIYYIIFFFILIYKIIEEEWFCKNYLPEFYNYTKENIIKSSKMLYKNISKRCSNIYSNIFLKKRIILINEEEIKVEDCELSEETAS